MADDGRATKHTYTTEVPTEVTVGFIGFLSGLRESCASLLSKHLDNEATRLRIREVELQVEAKEAGKRGPRPVV